jgi:hypothetical protein
MLSRRLGARKMFKRGVVVETATAAKTPAKMEEPTKEAIAKTEGLIMPPPPSRTTTTAQLEVKESDEMDVEETKPAEKFVEPEKPVRKGKAAGRAKRGRADSNVGTVTETANAIAEPTKTEEAPKEQDVEAMETEKTSSKAKRPVRASRTSSRASKAPNDVPAPTTATSKRRKIIEDDDDSKEEIQEPVAAKGRTTRSSIRRSVVPTTPTAAPEPVVVAIETVVIADEPEPAAVVAEAEIAKAVEEVTVAPVAPMMESERSSEEADEALVEEKPARGGRAGRGRAKASAASKRTAFAASSRSRRGQPAAEATETETSEEAPKKTTRGGRKKAAAVKKEEPVESEPSSPEPEVPEPIEWIKPAPKKVVEEVPDAVAAPVVADPAEPVVASPIATADAKSVVSPTEPTIVYKDSAEDSPKTPSKMFITPVLDIVSPATESTIIVKDVEPTDFVLPTKSAPDVFASAIATPVAVDKKRARDSKGSSTSKFVADSASVDESTLASPLVLATPPLRLASSPTVVEGAVSFSSDTKRRKQSESPTGNKPAVFVLDSPGPDMTINFTALSSTPLKALNLNGGTPLKDLFPMSPSSHFTVTSIAPVSASAASTSTRDADDDMMEIEEDKSVEEDEIAINTTSIAAAAAPIIVEETEEEERTTPIVAPTATSVAATPQDTVRRSVRLSREGSIVPGSVTSTSTAVDTNADRISTAPASKAGKVIGHKSTKSNTSAPSLKSTTDAKVKQVLEKKQKLEQERMEAQKLKAQKLEQQLDKSNHRVKERVQEKLDAAKKRREEIKKLKDDKKEVVSASSVAVVAAGFAPAPSSMPSSPAPSVSFAPSVMPKPTQDDPAVQLNSSNDDDEGEVVIEKAKKKAKTPLKSLWNKAKNSVTPLKKSKSKDDNKEDQPSAPDTPSRTLLSYLNPLSWGFSTFNGKKKDAEAANAAPSTPTMTKKQKRLSDPGSPSVAPLPPSNKPRRSSTESPARVEKPKPNLFGWNKPSNAALSVASTKPTPMSPSELPSPEPVTHQKPAMLPPAAPAIGSPSWVRMHQHGTLPATAQAHSPYQSPAKQPEKPKSKFAESPEQQYDINEYKYVNCELKSFIRAF